MVKHTEELKETAFFLGTLGHGRDRKQNKVLSLIYSSDEKRQAETLILTLLLLKGSVECM